MGTREQPRVCPLADCRRFLALVARDTESPCWLWQGETTTNGYGRFTVAGRRVRAHRWSLVNLGGRTIPPGRVVDHLCGVPLCVNPAHLEPVSVRTNTLRGTSPAAKNARKTTCPQGHPYDWLSPRGARRCRACHRAQKADARRRRRAAVQP